VTQSQEPTHYQAEGIQLVDAPSNELQQPATANLPLHYILTDKKKKGNHKYLQSVNF
jgi:hypothetical protein